MAKIIRFSRYYPARISKAKKETFFVAKILAGAGLDTHEIVEYLYVQNQSLIKNSSSTKEFIDNIKQMLADKESREYAEIMNNKKCSTIRENQGTYKQGDIVPLYSWCESPYKSKLMKICDAKIMSKLPILIDRNKIAIFYENENGVIEEKDVYPYGTSEYAEIANADGLTSYQFAKWFGVYNSHNIFRGYITYFKPIINK